MRNDHLTLDHWLAMAAGASDRALDRRLRRHGSSRTTFRVLWHLNTRSQENQADLARLLGTTGQTVSRHLERLEVAELITRYRDPYDRRSHVVQITPLGRETARQLGAVNAAHERRVTEVFGPAGEVLRLIDRLRRLVDRLDLDDSDDRTERRDARENKKLDEILVRRGFQVPDRTPRDEVAERAREERGILDPGARAMGDAELDAFFGSDDSED
jgi:MarR family transcriptional regulator, transcriptional regulator for hemolysin